MIYNRAITQRPSNFLPNRIAEKRGPIVYAKVEYAPAPTNVLYNPGIVQRPANFKPEIKKYKPFDVAAASDSYTSMYEGPKVRTGLESSFADLKKTIDDKFKDVKAMPPSVDKAAQALGLLGIISGLILGEDPREESSGIREKQFDEVLSVETLDQKYDEGPEREPFTRPPKYTVSGISEGFIPTSVTHIPSREYGEGPDREPFTRPPSALPDLEQKAAELETIVRTFVPKEVAIKYSPQNLNEIPILEFIDDIVVNQRSPERAVYLESMRQAAKKTKPPLERSEIFRVRLKNETRKWGLRELKDFAKTGEYKKYPRAQYIPWLSELWLVGF